MEEKKKPLITGAIFTSLQTFELSNVPITRTFDNSNYFFDPLEVRVIGGVLHYSFQCFPSVKFS